jgi:hypothetical protein
MRPLLALLLRPSTPVFWLLVDLLAALVLGRLAAGQPRPTQNLVRALRRLAVPYAALLAGAVAPQAMGLAGLDWQAGLTLGVGVAGGVLLLLGMAHLAARTAAFEPPVSPALPDAGPAGAPLLHALLHYGAEQFHWCFLRAALLGLLQAIVQATGQATGQVAPSLAAWLGLREAALYWAVWGAALLALPSLWDTAAGSPRLHKGIALAATSVLFLYTRNFWLCWALHAGIMLFAGVAHLRRPAGSGSH